MLLGAFGGFTIATTGDLAQAPGLAIDHIAHSPDLAPVGDIGIRDAATDTVRPAAERGPSVEMAVEPGNLRKALARVQRNKGAHGVDGVKIRRPRVNNR